MLNCVIDICSVNLYFNLALLFLQHEYKVFFCYSTFVPAFYATMWPYPSTISTLIFKVNYANMK